MILPTESVVITASAPAPIIPSTDAVTVLPALRIDSAFAIVHSEEFAIAFARSAVRGLMLRIT